MIQLVMTHEPNKVTFHLFFNQVARSLIFILVSEFEKRETQTLLDPPFSVFRHYHVLTLGQIRFKDRKTTARARETLNALTHIGYSIHEVNTHAHYENTHSGAREGEIEGNSIVEPNAIIIALSG